MGRHLSPRYGQVILVSGYPVLTAVNWSQHWCAICVQYQSSCAPKLATKCEIEHWLPCGADGRTGGRCTVTWLPNFLWWVDLLTHGAPQARFARQSSAIINSFDGRLKIWKSIFAAGPCGFRPFDFDSKLKVENQKFTIVIFNVWFLKNWKSQIYNLNCQFLFLRNMKLKNNFQCFENQRLKTENGQLVVFISCF